jgi:ribonuclease T1
MASPRRLRRPRRAPTFAVVLALLIGVAVAWRQSRERAAPAEAPSRVDEGAPPVPAPPRAPTGPGPSAAALDLAWLADPDEQATVAAVAAAIDRGGPFRYRKDGAIFENREGRLPRRARGYWREYTVPTPGEDDRGARRLIGGDRRELYYTRDHYRSFRVVRGAAP